MTDIEQARLSYLRKLRGDPCYLPHSIADCALMNGQWDNALLFRKHLEEIILREREEEPSE